MNINSLLNQKGLVAQHPSVDEIRSRSKGIANPLKLFYGETYDSQGHPIDSLKYYFFVSMFSKVLKQDGVNTDPLILVADVAACRNVSKGLNYQYMELGEERAKFVNQAKKIYDLDLRVVKMSEYLFTPEFQGKLERIVGLCNEHGLMSKVEKTVPESKMEIERKKGFAYSFDEIGTIIDLDIKVGPPREDLYDNVARDLATIEGRNPLMSLFLTPSFPLGKNWAYFFENDGIEEHGITAYKAGSKQLQAHRIVIGKTTLDEARKLIDSSFCPMNLELPNPVLDIGILSEMAGVCLGGGEFNLYNQFSSGKMKEQEIRERTLELLNNNILEKFKNV